MGKHNFSSKACRACGEGFIPTRKWQEFCSARCRMKYWASLNRRESPTLSDHERRITQLETALNIHLGGGSQETPTIDRERRRDGGRGKENAEVTAQRPALVAASRAEAGEEEISALRIPSRRSASTSNNE
jgi:hypothetical protein